MQEVGVALPFRVGSKDFAEGLASFREKRPANFTGA